VTRSEERPGLAEPLLTFAVVTGLASALFWIGEAVPFVKSNLHGALAVLFLYAPAVAARISKRPFDYRAAGLGIEPVGLGLKVVGVALVVTWPLFLAGFLFFYRYVCAPGAPRLAQDWAELFAPVCSRWLGWNGASFHLPPKFLLLALSQLVVVAVPEELFFRGYLLGRFEARWPPTRTVAGARVGKALLASSALFALGHYLVDFDVQRLAVFFPALVFGWMRARSGSLAAGALYHALCNLFSEVLYASFFR
jgi:uncharacterized protein